MRAINLNYDWRYAPDFKDAYLGAEFDDSAFETVQIPHCNQEIPYNNFDEEMYQFVSCYRKTLEVDAALLKKRLVLEFEACANYAEVYINGEYAFAHKGSYTAFRKEVNDFLKEGSNVIAVKLDSTERPEIPPFGGVVDYLVYGGIYREVYLYAYDDIYIPQIKVSPLDVLDKPKAEAQIRLNRSVESAVIKISIKDAAGAIVAEYNAEVEDADNITVTLDTPGISLWSPENPALYTLSATIGDESRSERFGYRTAKFTKKGFYLNGTPMKIRGLNRHQAYPYVGYAMPASAQVADAEYLKNDLGVNLVRTSHYPNSKHFLNRCDEIGLLVFTEIPGWQYVSGLEEWRDITVRHVEEMIEEDFNHPSIILWGVRINESGDDDELYARTSARARQLDKTRQTGGVRCTPFSHLLEDVYTYNDFIHEGGKIRLLPRFFVAKGRKPYLVTEYCGHVYPTKTFDHESKRQEHALRHARVIDKMYSRKAICGSIGWCMSDYNTHKDFGSGDKICYHGVSDMFRTDKMAAYVYKSFNDKVPVLELGSNMEIGDHAAGKVGDVYLFTNCEEVRLYKNDEHIATLDLAVERKRSKEFKHMPFPPVKLEDIIGNQLETKEGMSAGWARKIKKALLAIKKRGTFGAIFRHPLIFLSAITLHRMSVADITAIFGKYATTWGSKQVTYKLEGYNQGKLVASVTKGSVFEASLRVKADSTALIEKDTYDVCRVVVSAVSQCGNILPYANDVVKVRANDNLEIIGPTEFALLGGRRAFWVKTTGKSGTGEVTVESALGKHTLSFTVDKSSVEKL